MPGNQTRPERPGDTHRQNNGTPSYQVRQQANQPRLPTNNYDPHATQRVNSAGRSSRKGTSLPKRQKMIYAPRKRRKWPIVLILLLLVALGVGIAFSYNAEAQGEQEQQAALQQAA